MGQEKLAAAELPLDGFVDELDPGTKLMNGQYTITRFLNNGGFGITYLAKDSLDRDVVIKECFPNAFCRRSQTLVAARSRAHQGELRAVVKLFVQEARNLSKLIHPNIVGVHDRGEFDGRLWIAMDFVDGEDAAALLARKYPAGMPVDLVVAIVTAVGSALDYLHKQGLLHRDVKPANIMLTDVGLDPVWWTQGQAACAV